MSLSSGIKILILFSIFILSTWSTPGLGYPDYATAYTKIENDSQKTTPLSTASVKNSSDASPTYKTGRFVLGWWMWTPGDTVDDSMQNSLVAGYVPDQPLPFSHKLHAGDRQIACAYCHSGARRSASAVVPGLDTCMGCHQVVATDKEPIKKITEKWNKKEPIKWVRVHDLPDHVRFSHKPHVLASMSCESCHGDVKNMEKLGQWAPLQMGWCVSCHKERQAPINCQTCHY